MELKLTWISFLFLWFIREVDLSDQHLQEGSEGKVECVTKYINEGNLWPWIHYLCKHPCDSKDWSSVWCSTSPLLVGHRPGGCSWNKNGSLVTFTLTGVTKADAGKFWCVTEQITSDSYEMVVDVEVIQQIPSPALKQIIDLIPNPEQIISDLDITNRVEVMKTTKLSKDAKQVKIAKIKCEGNHACALALLQHESLNLNRSCWICLQMNQEWQTEQITIDLVKQNQCKIPKAMAILTLIGEAIKNKMNLDNIQTNCSTDKPMYSQLSFEVTTTKAEVCICSKEGKYDVGLSQCNLKIILKNNTNQCSILGKNGITVDFYCPFSILDSAPAAVWVCGTRAYHQLPQKWRGCCYAALLSTGTSVLIQDSSIENSRAKRDINRIPRFNGYVLSDPWTSPAANIGWSLFLGGGTTVALNKINGLAYSMLSLANDTEVALGLINNEMRNIRDAVIQNRLALDILTAEKGGVCKLLGTSCCFNIPDESKNISNIIQHMKNSIVIPPIVDNSWFSWFLNLGSGWFHWMMYTIAPVIFMILLIIICLPCLLRCISTLLQKAVTSVITMEGYKMVKMMDEEWYAPFNDLENIPN